MSFRAAKKRFIRAFNPVISLVCLSSSMLAAGHAAAGPISDIYAPTFQALDISNPSVDVSQASLAQRITARISDDLSGLSYAGATFSSYTDGVYRAFYANFGSYNRISGTAQDGIYETTLTIPRYAAEGTYSLSAYLSDAAGNSKSLSTSDLAYLGGATAIQVTSPGDTISPTLREFTLGASTVDASMGSVTQRITARITDALSGLSYAGATFSSYVDGVYRAFYANFGSYNLISGNAQDGIYETTVTIPQYAAQGTYTLSAYLSDAAGNSKSLQTGDLEYLGTSTAIQVISPGDAASPMLREFTLGSSVVDASQGSVTQQITARITDDLSGLSYAGATFSSYVDGVYRAFYANFGSYNRISGTAQDGIYATTLTIPQYAFEGTYSLSAYLSDTAGNSKSLQTGDLAYLGASVSLTVDSSPVPEPMSISLLCIGLIALVRMQRSR
jgi:hypothetical protein